MRFDFPNLKLAKAELFGFNNNKLDIPESRLESEDFELGLAHELTEETLKELVFPILNSLKRKYDLIYIFLTIHNLSILSLERYGFVADQFDTLERILNDR